MSNPSLPTNPVQKALADPSEYGYMARELVQCTFPHRDPGPVTSWSRRNGNLVLLIQPGIDPFTHQPLGIPYGMLARLFLIWLITEIVRTQERRISLNNTFNAFLREVGLDPNTGGGKRGDGKRLKEQLMRFMQCRISFVYEDSDHPQRGTWVNMQVAQGATLWWDVEHPEQGSLFESFILVSPELFQAIIENPVPLDLAAVRNLKRSPFALDVYVWSAYRVYLLGKRKQEQAIIPLARLREQFGAEYNRANNFKAALASTLIAVKAVFPDLDYELRARDLVIRTSKVPIPERTKEESYSTRRRPGDVSDSARLWFYQHYPQWNLQEALNDFNGWLQENPKIEPKNRNALFKKFVKTWVERNS